jgi:hypothetical protein
MVPVRCHRRYRIAPEPGDLHLGEHCGPDDAAEFDERVGAAGLALRDAIPEPGQIAEGPGSGVVVTFRRRRNAGVERHVGRQIHGEVGQIEASVVGDHVASALRRGQSSTSREAESRDENFE